MRVHTPSMSREPGPHEQVPELRSTVRPTQAITFATHLPGVPVWVRGSHGASGAQFGPDVPSGHTFDAVQTPLTIVIEFGHRQFSVCGRCPAVQVFGLVFGAAIVGAVQTPLMIFIVFGHRQFSACGR